MELPSATFRALDVLGRYLRELKIVRQAAPSVIGDVPAFVADQAIAIETSRFEVADSGRTISPHRAKIGRFSAAGNRLP